MGNGCFFQITNGETCKMFKNFLLMHLLDGPDLGHSMINYDGKFEKKR